MDGITFKLASSFSSRGLLTILVSWSKFHSFFQCKHIYPSLIIVCCPGTQRHSQSMCQARKINQTAYRLRHCSSALKSMCGNLVYVSQELVNDLNTQNFEMPYSYPFISIHSKTSVQMKDCAKGSMASLLHSRAITKPPVAHDYFPLKSVEFICLKLWSSGLKPIAMIRKKNWGWIQPLLAGTLSWASASCSRGGANLLYGMFVPHLGWHNGLAPICM